MITTWRDNSGFVMRINTTDLWNIIQTAGNQFFSVEFERRTDSRDGKAKAGDKRTMLCRTGMAKYKKGMIADADRELRDYQHGIITVWDVQAYLSNVKRGMTKTDAAFKAWRSIDVVTVTKCSILNHLAFASEFELPPDIVIGHHNITNEYRLAHMPRTPV